LLLLGHSSGILGRGGQGQTLSHQSIASGLVTGQAIGVALAQPHSTPKGSPSGGFMGSTLLADCQAQWWPCPAGGCGGSVEAIATGGLWWPPLLRRSPHSAGGKSLLLIQGETAGMARPTPEQLEQRRQRMAEAEGLGGWHLATLCDGEDDAGRPLAWYAYEHLDGRRAVVWDDGTTDDPDMQAWLAARARPAAPRPMPTAAAGAVPWWAWWR
jgi:hypothetical protein